MGREDRERRYETMVVLRADLLEAGVKEQIERNRRFLETNGAVVSGVHEWGLRELAYPIEKERRGYYVLFEYTGSAAALGELERNLKLSDVTLRFVSVRQGRDTLPASPPPRYDQPEEERAEPVRVDDEEEGAPEGSLGEAEQGADEDRE